MAWGFAAAAALVAAQAPLRAQDAPPETNESGSIGPRELDNFTINADARVLGATLGSGKTLTVDADPQRHLYLVPSGKVRVNGQEAAARDGVAITGVDKIEIEAGEDVELVLVDSR